jgi:LysM repeat protein
LSDSTIGIKVADGSYYPVLEHGFKGRKRLILTTVKDNQSKVQIDLYRGNGSGLTDARYIGSLLIENIPPAKQGVPEIELFIGVDESGQLSAEANDVRTGESQKFTTSLATLPSADIDGEPDFTMGEQESEGMDFAESPLTGEAYPVSDADSQRVRRNGPNVLLLVLFVVLGIVLVGAIAFFVYRVIQGPKLAQVVSPPAVTQPARQPAPAVQQPAAAQPVAEPTPPPAAAPAEVTYRIKQGDTLWDISSTYYRNPWLYPRLAKANNIKNPDLIFAGTRIVIPQD